MKIRTSSRIFLVVSVALLLCAGTAVAQSAAEKQAAMEKKITSLCVEKLGKDAETIRVTVVGNKAILTGEVAEKSTEELAKEVALSVPGIEKVDNQIKAKGAAKVFGGKITKETEDAKLESDAKDRIKEQVGKDFAKAIEVEASGGVVSLRGKVPDQTRREQAVKAVQEMKGVKKVVDLISVGK